MNSTTTNVLLIICIIGISYLLFFTHIVVPKAIAHCAQVANSLETTRDAAGNEKVTSEDASAYIKNTISCLTDRI